jgi:uncharacterized protein (DUF362 family)
MITGRGPALRNVVEPGIIVAGSNRVATDAVCMALMKMNWAKRVSEVKVLEHEQFKVAVRLDLGSPKIEDIDLRVSNMTEDSGFQDVVNGIREELGQNKG